MEKNVQNAKKTVFFLLSALVGGAAWRLQAPWEIGALVMGAGLFCLFSARSHRGIMQACLAAALLPFSGCGDKNGEASPDAPAKPAMVYTNDTERRMADPAYVETLRKVANERMTLAGDLQSAQSALNARIERLKAGAPEGKAWDETDAEYLRLKAELEAVQQQNEALDLRARETVSAKIKEGGEETRRRDKAAAEAHIGEFEKAKAQAEAVIAAGMEAGTPEAREKAFKEADAIMRRYMPSAQKAE